MPDDSKWGEFLTTYLPSKILLSQVYQEKAVKDKERYRVEMEDYKERLKAHQVISDAIPIQQRFPVFDVEMVEANTKNGTERESPENESNFSKSDTGEEEEEEEDEDEYDDEITEKDDEDFSDAETMPVAGDATVESGNAGTSETSAAVATAVAGDFQVVTGEEKSVEEESEGSLEDGSIRRRETKQDSAPDVQHDDFITSIP